MRSALHDSIPALFVFLVLAVLTSFRLSKLPNYEHEKGKKRPESNLARGEVGPRDEVSLTRFDSSLLV